MYITVCIYMVFENENFTFLLVLDLLESPVISLFLMDLRSFINIVVSLTSNKAKPSVKFI